MATHTINRELKPLYDAFRSNPAYHLRYAWSGWPSKERFEQTPIELFNELCERWESDGIRLLEHNWTDKKIQLLFSAKPNISPEFLATRAKGRFDHAIRNAGLRMPLSRKLALRSVGENVVSEVESYIEEQVGRAQLVNERFESVLKKLTTVNHEVDLRIPSETKRGRYWYNLHLVLVTAERYRIGDEHRLTTIRDWSLASAAKHGYSISRLSVMPDHLHVALRGNHAQSPSAIVDVLRNNIAFALGQEKIWEDSFYAGTFGEYNMEAIRRQRDSTYTPE